MNQHLLVHRAMTLLAAVVLSASTRAQEQPSLSTVLTRLGAYISAYAEQLPATIASEHYRQWAPFGQTQVILDSEFGIIQVPDHSGWLGFRDVLRVNGKAVRNREQRLEALFRNSSHSAMRQARRIALESARFNIGWVARTINDPSVVLELLDARNASRMRFTKTMEETIDHIAMWVIRFEEIAKPTIIRSAAGGDQPSTGRAWVDPVTGGLYRAQVIVNSPGSFNGTVDVRFLFDSKLRVLVPAVMTERYLSLAGLESFGEATYSNYRRFSVDARLVEP